MTYWKDIKGIYLIERINIDKKEDDPIYYVEHIRLPSKKQSAYFILLLFIPFMSLV